MSAIDKVNSLDKEKVRLRQRIAQIDKEKRELIIQYIKEVVYSFKYYIITSEGNHPYLSTSSRPYDTSFQDWNKELQELIEFMNSVGVRDKETFGWEEDGHNISVTYHDWNSKSFLILNTFLDDRDSWDRSVHGDYLLYSSNKLVDYWAKKGIRLEVSGQEDTRLRCMTAMKQALNRHFEDNGKEKLN